MGASWIHGVRGNPLTDLADELDIKRATTDYGNHIVRDAQGRIVDEDDLPEDFEVVTSIEHEYAADHAELSPQADDEGDEFGGGDVLFPSGYSTLIRGLDTGFQVNLGAEVDLVDTTGPTVGVHTADETFAAEAVLVTVPLGVLKAGTINFVPALSQPGSERSTGSAWDSSTRSLCASHRSSGMRMPISLATSVRSGVTSPSG